MNYDWLIVGGGIHGTHLAARLVGDAKVRPEKLGIIDPAESLLKRWYKNTATTGMKHLRSASVHHLDLGSHALGNFAKKQNRRGLFKAPYQRPSLRLFNEHCEHVISKFALQERHIQAEALGLSVQGEHSEVRLSKGQTLHSAKVILALGGAPDKKQPAELSNDDPRIQHIFDDKELNWPVQKQSIAVVGGGISAAQIALRLQKEGHRVHLISRHRFREHQFDSSPGWLGPKLMAGFKRERSVIRRREIIQSARYRGSLPPDLKRTLQRAIRKEELTHHLAEVQEVRRSEQTLQLHLSTSKRVEVERVFLATGYESVRPGGRFVDELIKDAGLPCADCGFPLVNYSLQWKYPSLFVSGALAELELGPVARNIAGARRAADRILSGALIS